MNTVSLVGSISRLAGGLFESVRRLHQEIIKGNLRAGQEAQVDGRAEADAVQVTVFGMRDAMTEEDRAAWAPVPAQALKVRGPFSFGYMPDLGASLRRINPDVTHLHGLWQYPSIATSHWHHQSRRPYMVSPHGMLDGWALRNSAWKKRLAWAAFERATLREAACIRALCDSEARSIRSLGLSNPIAIIPNGVDLPALATSAKLECVDGYEDLLVPGRRVLLYLGRIHPKKGLVRLLEAWARARASDEWLLVIAGWDQHGHQAELEEFASSLHVSWAHSGRQPGPGTSLLFPGPQFGASKHAWLRRCDAFVLPSFSEGLPMAVLEAWSFGKPALLTPQCNLPEGWQAGAALRVEPTTTGIQAGLTELFETNEDWREKAGTRGRELVAREFAWPQVAAEMKEVYGWLIGSGPKPNSLTEK